jgi:dynein heavy chain 2
VNSIESIVDREDYLPHVRGGNDHDGGRSGKGGEMITSSSTSSYYGKLTSPLVTGLIRLRQLKAMINEVIHLSELFLFDIEGYKRFLSFCDNLLSKINSEEKSKFDNWLSDMSSKYEDDDPSLKLSGSLLGFKDGILVVNFPETLIIFLRDYRQLNELGYNLPLPSSTSRGTDSKKGGRGKTLGDCALDAERFYRYGMLLKKTANFYNSISEQIIDVQEQLLLGSLSSFANLVVSSSSDGGGKGGKKGSSSNSTLNWSNPTECESFISTLQDAAEKLASENRSLRKVHEWLINQTISLMNIDLHRQTELWKSKWRLMKEKILTIKSKYSEKDSKLWLLHWDHQVYKALEISYQLGLEYVNDNINEIKIELIFNNKLLDFKPSIEQIRQSYYRELKKFITIPFSFEAFSGLFL